MTAFTPLGKKFSLTKKIQKKKILFKSFTLRTKFNLDFHNLHRYNAL